MRSAAVASVAIHLGLIGGAFLFLQFQPAVNEADAESVSVDIISMDMVSTDPSEMVTDANETLVSAGAELEAEEVPETAEAEPVEMAQAEPARAVQEVAEPVAVAEIEPSESDEIASAEVLTAAPDSIAPVEAAMPQMVDAAAAIVADSVQPSQSDPLEAVRTATIGALMPEPPIQQIPPALLRPAEPIKPLETASLSPVVEEDLQVAPVPKPRIVRKAVEAKVEPAKEQPKQPAEKPKQAEKPAEKQQKKPPSKQASLGNGGAAEADSAASKKSGGGQGKKNDGGSAAASKYPGLVQAKVTRSARYPSKARGENGEALVSFTVNAGGSVVKVTLARSSGNAALDTAALAAVDRAAPFPPIPEAAGRSTWSFTVPLYFKK